jgi:hypothetical protein
MMTIRLWLKSPKTEHNLHKILPMDIILRHFQKLSILTVHLSNTLLNVILPWSPQSSTRLSRQNFSCIYCLLCSSYRYSQWTSHRFQYPNLKLIGDQYRALSSSLSKKFILLQPFASYETLGLQKKNRGTNLAGKHDIIVSGSPKTISRHNATIWQKSEYVCLH